MFTAENVFFFYTECIYWTWNGRKRGDERKYTFKEVDRFVSLRFFYYCNC